MDLAVSCFLYARLPTTRRKPLWESRGWTPATRSAADDLALLRWITPTPPMVLCLFSNPVRKCGSPEQPLFEGLGHPTAKRTDELGEIFSTETDEIH